MSDYLDHHLNETPDDDFVIVIAVRHPVSQTINHVIEWCSDAQVYYEIVASSEKVPQFPDAADHRVPDIPFMIQAVEDAFSYEKDKAVVLALLGEQEAKTDVVRAIARAVDSHMVVRDLAEGGLTYIKFHGDAVDEPTKEQEMAEEAEELTLEELVAMADEGDEEAVEALTEVCGEYDIDPDEYATWEEVGELLAAALEEEPEEGEPEEEEEEEASDGGWTAADLKGKTLKEVREIAKAAGIENWKTGPRAELVASLVEGTGDGEPEEEEAPKKGTSRTSKAAEASGGGVDIKALASAIVDEIVSRLS